MNFEKWMKKRGNNKLNAYAKNPYHVSWIKRIPMWGKIAVPAALAMTAAVVVISVGVLPHLGMNKGAMNKASNSEAQYSSIAQDKNATTSQYKPGSQPQSTMSEGQSTPLQPTVLNFTYQDISYTRSSGTLDSTKGYLKYLGEKIATINVQGTNQQSEEINLYYIKNIDSEVAVAANYSFDSTYYIYLNYSCHFHDIDDFVALLSPASEMSINKILYFDKTNDAGVEQKFSNYSDADIYNIFFDDGTIEGYTAMDYDYESSYKYYYLGLNIPALGDINFTAYFYDSGYIVFNFLNDNHIFNLGQQRYQSFATYLDNYKVS